MENIYTSFFIPGLSCAELSLLCMLDYNKIDYTLLFWKAYSFKYCPTGNNIADNFSFDNYCDLAYDFFSLKRRKMFAESYEKILLELRNGYQALITIDGYECPWHWAYKNEHIGHVFFAHNIDDVNNNLLCYDGQFSKHQVQINNEDLKVNPQHKIEIFLYKPAAEIPSHSNIFKESLEFILSENSVKDVELFCNECLTKIDYEKDFPYKQNRNMKAPIYGVIQRIGSIRRMYSDFLKKHARRDYIGDDLLEKLIYLSGKWQTFNVRLLKNAHLQTQKNEESLKALLEHIRDEEIMVYNMLSSIKL